jgi:K+-transporting ATPase ATPase A chain
MDAVLLVSLVVGGTALLSWPLGMWLRWAMDPVAPGPRRRRLEAAFARVAGAGASEGQGWSRWAVSMLAFNVAMFVVVYGVLVLQHHLPLNPDGKGEVEPSLAFHTAISFVTNTNLQHYSGEVALSYLSQMALMWLQFVSAATGLAVLTAIARGLSGRRDVGNFFVDLLRATGLVLLPLAAVGATLLAVGGTPMTFQGAVQVTTLEGAAQTLSRGPVAAFVAIKQLGTNGGGFFGPNSTHPFENPTFFTNVVSVMAIPLIPMASVWMFGRIVGRPRHAAVLFAVMLVLLVAKVGGAVALESEPTAAFQGLPIASDVGNLEGKELRFGAGAGPLWAALTTCTSNGSVNAMHDSLNPLTGSIAMAGMWLNATFGGVGVGMVNMLVYVFVAVFVAGMMVGRTPEYLNRRVEKREVTFAILCLLAHALFILVPTAIFSVTSWGVGTPNDGGPHGFSEILYEFSSASANNGSGFEGLGDGTVPWNVSTGLVMLFARFLPILLPLAIAGSMAAKRRSADSAGTLGVEDGTFGVMLLGTVLLVGALTFLPAAVLGPIVEHVLHR